MGNPQEDSPVSHLESATHPEMVTLKVQTISKRSGIPFTDFYAAWEALQIPIRITREDAKASVDTQGKWAIDPQSTLSRALRPGGGQLITKIGNLYIVSFPDEGLEDDVAKNYTDRERGLERITTDVTFKEGADGLLQIDFDQVISVLNNSGAEIIPSGKELVTHFAQAAKEWTTSSRLSPPLNGTQSDFEIRLSLGHGILHDGLYRKWSTENSVLSTPVYHGHPSLHIGIRPHETPTFDSTLIAKAIVIGGKIDHAFRAMQPQSH